MKILEYNLLKDIGYGAEITDQDVRNIVLAAYEEFGAGLSYVWYVPRELYWHITALRDAEILEGKLFLVGHPVLVTSELLIDLGGSRGERFAEMLFACELGAICIRRVRIPSSVYGRRIFKHDIVNERFKTVIEEGKRKGEL